MDITAVIITKNERFNLRQCLEALSGFGIPVVVCDTGSSDGSPELAAGMGAKVCHFTWCDDFSAAKNYAASQAESDIILSLDTDEFISEADKTLLERIIHQHPNDIGRIHLRNRFTYDGEVRYSDERLPRIYDRRFFQFEGRVHEQLSQVKDAVLLEEGPIPGDLGGVGEQSGSRYAAEISYYDAPVTVIHVGYDLSEDEKKKKADRNLRLLEQELEEFLGEQGQLGTDLEQRDPGGPAGEADCQERGAYIYYQIGKSHYMAGRFPEAAEAFGHGLEFDVDERRDFLVDMVTSYGYALVNSGREQEALALLGVEDTFRSDADFEFVLGLICMRTARFDEAIEHFDMAASLPTSRVEGASSYLAYYNAGVVLECLGRTPEALNYYRKCGSYIKAQERINAL